MAVATAYVLYREKLRLPKVASSLGPLALSTGLARLLLDRHWASDVLGGYCAGIGLGAASAGAYELGCSSAEG